MAASKIVRNGSARGETGYIVPPDDEPALRDALSRLVGDPELRRRMGEAGRARALRLFTAEAMARAFEQLYERLGRARR